jgi:uncharacterized membrane protein YhiD involved in acid resistance
VGISAPRTGWPLGVRLAVACTGLGGVCIVASLLVAYLIADHSSSDSSPSSLVAIALGGLGFLSVLLGAALFAGVGLARLRRLGRPAGPSRPGSG